MAQQIKSFATKPDDLDLTLETHMVAEPKEPSPASYSLTSICAP